MSEAFYKSIGKKVSKMRVLVTIRNSPAQVYMVKLLTQSLVSEVRELIYKRKHSQAVVTVMTKGSFERQVDEREVPIVKADLILSRNNAMWDLT